MRVSRIETKTSKQMAVVLILVVVLSTSLVLTNMLVFSAGAIARKNEDFMVRLESFGYTGKQSEVDQESLGLSDHKTTADFTKSGKAVVLAFDDGWGSQYTDARPILDKYGFKVTFFIVCTYPGMGQYMSWSEIKDLQRSGHDIESHSMTHKDLTMLSPQDLDYEVGQSKQCLFDHGIDSRVFATPYNTGWHNSNVINAISRYYDIAKNGNGELAYMHCDGLPKSVSNQTDCRTYSASPDSSDKRLNPMNRYSIRTWSHNYYDELYSHNDTKTLQAFVREVNLPYKEGTTFATTTIPVLEYHKIDMTGSSTSTTPALFDAELQYLRDNGFNMLTMDDFRYDEKTNYLSLNYH